MSWQLICKNKLSDIKKPAIKVTSLETHQSWCCKLTKQITKCQVLKSYTNKFSHDILKHGYL